MTYRAFPAIFLFMCSSAFSASPVSEQGSILPQGVYSYGYSAPGQIQIKNANGSISPHFFLDGSFIYYHADEEGLDLATSAALVDQGTNYAVVSTANSQTLFSSFGYKPGFKVGAGVSFSSWTLAGEYTWIRQTTNTYATAPSANISGATNVWLINNWFEQLSPVGQPICSTYLQSKWHLSMNLADLMLSRTCYQSRHFLITPSFGLMGASISQKLNIDILVPSQVVDGQVGPIYSNNSSKSWGIGPKAELQASLLLGKGFRLETDLSVALLFTKYPQVEHKELVASEDAAYSTLYSQFKNYCCTRPIAEMGLGTGWGSYFYGEKYHIDISASYDFFVFWEQNMIRKQVDSVVAGVGASAGSLNLQGLTCKARFDF